MQKSGHYQGSDNIWQKLHGMKDAVSTHGVSDEIIIRQNYYGSRTFTGAITIIYKSDGSEDRSIFINVKNMVGNEIQLKEITADQAHLLGHMHQNLIKNNLNLSPTKYHVYVFIIETDF